MGQPPLLCTQLAIYTSRLFSVPFGAERTLHSPLLLFHSHRQMQTPPLKSRYAIMQPFTAIVGSTDPFQ